MPGTPEGLADSVPPERRDIQSLQNAGEPEGAQFGIERMR